LPETFDFQDTQPMADLQTPDRTVAPRFLLIDDDPVQRMVLGKVANKAGYAVTTAATVEEAIKELDRQPFDCIVLDLLLNGENGILMLGEIAKLNSDALLIVTSGASAALRESTLQLAVHLGLDVVDLPKPVNLASLRALLEPDTNIAQPTWP
jgi:ActR/RegA family two-component response regulator